MYTRAVTLLRRILLLVLLPFWAPWRCWQWLRWRRLVPRVVRLDLGGPLVDFRAGRGGVWQRWVPAGPCLVEIVEFLALLAEDPRVQKLVIECRGLRLGLGQAEELRQALAALQQAGKEVLVYSESYDLATYWLAVNVQAAMAPTGHVAPLGVALSARLLRGLLDRAGVRAELMALGKYKSARETFTSEALSAPASEMMQSLADDLGGQLTRHLAVRLDCSEEQVRATLAQGPFRADEALAKRLVDACGYEDELLPPRHGEGAAVPAQRYVRRARFASWWPRPPLRVGVVNIHGAIQSGHEGPGLAGRPTATSRAVLEAAEVLSRQRHLDAILVRVDSPGGSALASDLMWHALGKLTAGKRTHVSMGSMAASGGYYVSGLAGARVWASQATLTGSIGVLAGKMDASGLLSRLGIAQSVFKSEASADYYSVARPWTEAELEHLSRDLDASYHDFVSKMATARGMTVESLHEHAQGRVWTGQQAKARGLVDELGGLADIAREIRRELGAPARRRIQWLQARTGSGWRERAGALVGAAQSLAMPAWVAPLGEVAELHSLLGTGESLLAYCPVAIERAGD